MSRINLEQLNSILQIRLLVARAAQKDSLSWWEDDSLTDSGAFLLEKLFLTAPLDAAKKLALKSAHGRYDAAFSGDDHALHLFCLDDRGEQDFPYQDIQIASIPIVPGPLPDLDTLRIYLQQVVGNPPVYKVISERANRRIEIRVADQALISEPLELAKVFAWASLESKPDYPLFPYISTYS